MSLADMRRDYRQRDLTETDVDADPFRQFSLWMNQAIEAQMPEPNAMTLATATPDGTPSARIVLLKGVDTAGFVFYTNYESDKGQQIALNPRVALVFLWVDLERQVRVEGTASLMNAAESDAYFQTRPLGSQLGAWASHQSRVIPSRALLEQRLQELQTQFAEQTVPRPPNWGGYRVTPRSIEFWQGRRNRLHDRIRYTLQEDSWHIERLSP